jgi:aryl-alcohol dehydrogenase-like predicted oxidoreductase
METRVIGKSGPAISAIGLGCVTFGREVDQDTSFRLLDYAVEKGVNLLDTAESYGGGQSRAMRAKSFDIRDDREVSAEISSSEKIIGRWLKARGERDRVVICTKVRTRGAGGSAESITESLRASLERMGIDSVDIFMMHNPDEQVPIDETLDELRACVDRGLVRTLGASNYSAAQTAEALAVSSARDWPRFDVVQPPYSLIVRGVEDELLPLCIAKQIAVMAFSPLCQGFLSGKYTRDSAAIPSGSRFDILPTHGPRYFTDRNFRILDRLRARADAMGVPLVRLAVAWGMTHAAVTTTLIGARTPAHIDNGLEAVDMALGADLRAEMSAWG